MNSKGIIYTVVAVVIAVILSVCILVPVIEEGVKTTDTYTNSGGYYRMDTAKSTDTGTTTIEWDHTKPLEIVTNDVVQTIDNTGMAAYTFLTLCTNTHVENQDSFIIRMLYRSVADITIQLYVNAVAISSSTISSGQDVTITLNSGTMSYTVSQTGADDVTTTKTYSDVYYAKSGGSFVMKKASESCYITPTSGYLFRGITTVSSNNFDLSVSGQNLTTATISSKDGAHTLSTDNISITGTTETIAKNLYKVEGVTFDGCLDSSTTATSVSCSTLIVPYQVTAELAVHADSSTIAILNVIPLLVIIGIVIATVGMLKFRD